MINDNGVTERKRARLHGESRGEHPKFGHPVGTVGCPHRLAGLLKFGRARRCVMDTRLGVRLDSAEILNQSTLPAVRSAGGVQPAAYPRAVIVL